MTANTKMTEEKIMKIVAKLIFDELPERFPYNLQLKMELALKEAYQAGRAEMAEDDQWKILHDIIERENRRYYEALLSISKNTCCDRCQEAALVAKGALAQRDGGKNV